MTLDCLLVCCQDLNFFGVSIVFIIFGRKVEFLGRAQETAKMKIRDHSLGALITRIMIQLGPLWSPLFWKLPYPAVLGAGRLTKLSVARGLGVRPQAAATGRCRVRYQ